MVLVDTSVWIDFLKGTETPQTVFLEQLMKDEVDLFTTGVVLQEILNGISKPAVQKEIEANFSALLWIMPSVKTHIKAAEIFSDCRKKGFQIRSSIDCLLAAIAIENDLHLLHKDRDFDFITKVFPLKTL